MSVNRKTGQVLVLPFIRGSIAWWQGPNVEQNPFRWTLYIRGVNGEDLSYAIKKVQFTLHPSFKQPIRILEQYPFEITEQGWGEFDIEVKIEFQDPNESSITFGHWLKLHPGNGEPDKEGEPVVHEFYDEFIFNEPTETMYNLLTNHKPIYHENINSSLWTSFNEAQYLKKIMEAQNYINTELQKAIDLLIDTDKKNYENGASNNSSPFPTSATTPLSPIVTSSSTSTPVPAGISVSSSTPRVSVPLSSSLNSRAISPAKQQGLPSSTLNINTDNSSNSTAGNNNNNISINYSQNANNMPIQLNPNLNSFTTDGINTSYTTSNNISINLGPNINKTTIMNTMKHSNTVPISQNYTNVNTRVTRSSPNNNYLR